MKVIDANTGLELREGMTFHNVLGTVKVIKIIPGIRAATAILEMPVKGPFMKADGSMISESKQRMTQAVPLQVRWTHPGFFLRHVAFLPS